MINQYFIGSAYTCSGMTATGAVLAIRAKLHVYSRQGDNALPYIAAVGFLTPPGRQHNQYIISYLKALPR